LDPAFVTTCPTPIGNDQWQRFTTASALVAPRHVVLMLVDGVVDGVVGAGVVDAEGVHLPTWCWGR